MSFFNDKDMITRWKSSINRNELRPNPLKASKTHLQALKAVESIFKILPFCLQHAGCTTILHAVAHRNPIQQDIGVCGSNATHKKTTGKWNERWEEWREPRTRKRVICERDSALSMYRPWPDFPRSIPFTTCVCGKSMGLCQLFRIRLEWIVVSLSCHPHKHSPRTNYMYNNHSHTQS